MSLPNIPDIDPLITLTRQEVFHLLLASIAMEEIGLSHILNAQGEKLQKTLSYDLSIEEMVIINKSVEQIMRNIVKNQMLLQYKLEDVLSLEKEQCDEHDEGE